MDEILRDPDAPSDEFVLDLEVKSLRDTRDLLEKVGLKDALSFIEENPHPRLWRLLAEAALEALDLQMAEAAYVRCKDYPGILFTKTLSKIQNNSVKKAEVAAWFKDFDEAERLYLEADMRSLAVRMRKRLGDWFKVIQLLKTGSGGNDAEMEEAYNEVAINENESILEQFHEDFFSFSRSDIILPKGTNGMRLFNITKKQVILKNWLNVITSLRTTTTWKTSLIFCNQMIPC